MARRRSDHQRLGFAVQLGTVGAVGRFLEDPLDLPWAAVEFLARAARPRRRVVGEQVRAPLADAGRAGVADPRPTQLPLRSRSGATRARGSFPMGVESRRKDPVTLSSTRWAGCARRLWRIVDVTIVAVIAETVGHLPSGFCLPRQRCPCPAAAAGRRNPAFLQAAVLLVCLVQLGFSSHFTRRSSSLSASHAVTNVRGQCT